MSTTTTPTLTTSDNNLPGQNNDTGSSHPAVDMDDTTGSNGGPANDRLSDDDTDDASYSTKPNQSRSDSARVEDRGISSSTGDTDPGQSGGRAQS